MNQEQYNDWLNKLEDGIIDNVDDAIEETELPSVCPHCVATEFLDDKLTCILEDLYRIGKGNNHQHLLGSIYKARVDIATKQYVMDQIESQMVLLFEDEIKQDLMALRKSQ